MSTRSEDARLELERLADSLAQSLLDVPGNQLVEVMGNEARVEVAAREVDEVVARSVKAYKHSRLEAAQAERQRRLASLAKGQPNIPVSPQARRDLFFARLQAQPELTAAYRGLDAFTDEDILDALLQLNELGLLGEDDH